MDMNTTTPNTHNSSNDDIQEMQQALLELRETLLVNRKRTLEESSEKPNSVLRDSSTSASPLTKKPRSDRSQ